MAKKNDNHAKWPWDDIKAEYYIAYPMSLTEFFAIKYPLIPLNTWKDYARGWKAEREAYRHKLNADKLKKYEAMANKVSEKMVRTGMGLMDAGIDKLTVPGRVFDEATGQEIMRLKEGLDETTHARVVAVGAKMAMEAVKVNRDTITVHKDADEAPEKQPVDKDRQVLNEIVMNPKALEAAKKLLKALPSA